jgi:uncharacterized protein (TIGR02679 family)
MIEHRPAHRLADQSPLPADHAARVAAVLATADWTWLTHAVRIAWEADLARVSVRIDLDALDDAATAGMANFMQWPTHRTGRIALSLTRLDRLLRASGLQAGLAQCLAAAIGRPLKDRAGERRALASAQRAANEQTWADALAHPACERHPRLADWLAAERNAGKLPADPPTLARALRGALAVLAQLPHPGTSQARLASTTLGSAHALDKGSVPATVLRAIACLAGSGIVPTDAAGQRELWASVGIARDTVSSTVLLLNVRLPGDDPLCTTLAVNAAHGIPVRITLDQMQRYGDTDKPNGPTDPAVWVCENPSVLEAAAEQLGTGSAPLICVEGRPSVAAHRLLKHLRALGSHLRYHGDFDWPGLTIAADLITTGTAPWRMMATDYLAALGTHPDLPLLPDRPPNTTSPWDISLAEAMGKHRRQIEEEHIVDQLLTDLATGRNGA